MNEQTENKTPTSQFLKTDGGRTKSNAIEVPSISLPKGGGAIKGIDEKFSVNAVNGTASFSIPLPFSQARGASPSLSLSYNSGAGNGIFGLGWNLNLASIKRKTDKGLPQYLDSIESDTFLFSEAEDLVPEFKKENDGSFSIDVNRDYIINEKDSPDTFFKIRFYKPRIEGLFARIERWTEKANGRIKWRVITKENVTTLFGWTDGAIIANPDDPAKIYEWLPEFVFDDKGNCFHNIYEKEDEKDFDISLLYNRNRFTRGADKEIKISYTTLYLTKVFYGNKTPYKHFGDVFPVETDYMFQTHFDFGKPLKNDLFETINQWDFRPDAFSDYKAGFEIRTTRLCKRVLLFHVFDELALKPDKSDKKTLIKSLNFEYDTSTQADFTFLKSITAHGYIKKPDGSFSSKNLPPIEFEYQKHDWNKGVKSISAEDLVHAPSGLDDQHYQFTDLFNEGLSGILTEQADGWFYKHNLGDGKFAQAELVTPKPSFVGLGRQMQLADLDADGGKQLVSYSTEPKGYFELDDDNEWQGFRKFQSLPNIDLGDANARMLDLNGDGRPEVLITEDNVFTWYQSEGRNGFSQIHKTLKPYDEEAGPHIVFADPLQTIFLADMSGDGMTDIVRIRNGEVCYWPNLGYGKFGSKIAMDNAPLFDHPDSFNPSFLRLADIDGSGTTDLIYLGKNKFTCWMNLSGNTFSNTPFEIDAFPDVHNLSKITVTDLLGNGVACIVWSSGLPKDTNSPLRYIDLMNGKKPHIMVSYKNNLGKEVLIEYTASIKFYIEDKLAGKQWITKLHFPVHCISKTETVDKISGWHFISSYKYHHGYYDHPEREFRGFGMVEQTDAEHFENWVKRDATNIVDAELHQEPVVSKTWYHTGAFLQKDKILNQFAKDYWYKEMERQSFTATHREVELPDARLVAAPGIDSSILDHLSVQEWQEALRVCKGMGLRSETFAKDAMKFGDTNEARKKELTPFSTATHNCIIELLQPKGRNKHAVFIVKESEAITYSYERNTEDPRIAHTLNIAFDEYGNVKESASVVYPRLQTDNSLPAVTQAEQSRTIITYQKNEFTNDVANLDNDYRLRMPSEAMIFELKGVTKTGPTFTLNDFDNILSSSNEVVYHQIDAEPLAGNSQKRLIEHVRTNYFKNNLSGTLPLNHLESLALPFENYQLAYTPELLTDIYSAKKTDIEMANIMIEGKFSHSIDEKGNEDANWWIRSCTVQFIEGIETVVDAQNRFYVPISYTDPYDSKTKVKYYSDYFLFIKETEDELGNKSTVDLFNFRTLSPQRMSDLNNNLSEVIADELGLVKAMAVMGKELQADEITGLDEITENEQTDIDSFFITANTAGICNSDILQTTAKQLLAHASARFIYDFEAYSKTGKPAVVASIARETHYRKEDGSLNPESKIQISFEFSNGIGKVIMKKVQAEPGQAKLVMVDENNLVSITAPDPDTTPFLRWVGNGKTILNNKGKAVKQYEPFFSVSPKFEDEKELVETGITPILYYDAIGRLMKTEMPDGTFSKGEFDSWKHIVFDANDTVIDSDWYQRRTDHARPDFIADPKEQNAAVKSAVHYNTPSELHLDTLGRPILQIENNGKDITGNDNLFKTKIELDMEGNLRKVTDARELPENANKGNLVMQYKYDMLGNLVYQNSMDAGQRWLLHNVLGNPLRTWDERDHEFQYQYDELHRPLQSIVINKVGKPGDQILNNIFDRIFYGEKEPNPELKNLRGQVIKHFDTGGVVETPEYDFQGKPVTTSRKLFKDYKSVVNWIDANLQVDLEDEFTFSTEIDALGRVTKQTVPDGSIITPSYNEAALLNGETVVHKEPAATTTYIKDIDYNEKGQRNKIVYGNNVTTRFYYDAVTFRLNHLETKKQNNELLQDLYYTYDPIGNIIFIEDKAIPIRFFANSKIEPVSEYNYDALYRLKEASGRENKAALSFGKKDNWNDKPFMSAINPGDAMAVWDYTQKYEYDEVGNIKLMSHQAGGKSWTRKYEYEKINNRLISSTIGAGKKAFPYLYTHHTEHGFIAKMPHLDEMGWNFKEELVKSIQQKVNPGNGTAETTYYQYDAQGQRLRKITENFAKKNVNPTNKEERIYISGYEVYKKHSSPNAGLERISLSLLDGDHRFVMIETRNDVDDGTEKKLVRYQLHNHLGSACLELNDAVDPQMISYEEYHPYGTSAYQAINNKIKSAAKRYRYTGLERDEETGFGYHSARYYLPWLGRWATADPMYKIDVRQKKDDNHQTLAVNKRAKKIQTPHSNLYAYCINHPIKYIDLEGREEEVKSHHSESEKEKDSENEELGIKAIISILEAPLEYAEHYAHHAKYANVGALKLLTKAAGGIGLAIEVSVAYQNKGIRGATQELTFSGTSLVIGSIAGGIPGIAIGLTIKFVGPAIIERFGPAVNEYMTRRDDRLDKAKLDFLATNVGLPPRDEEKQRFAELYPVTAANQDTQARIDKYLKVQRDSLRESFQVIQEHVVKVKNDLIQLRKEGVNETFENLWEADEFYLKYDLQKVADKYDYNLRSNN